MADAAGAGRRELDTGTEQLLCHVEARVAHLTLNRPDARNALTMDMKRALHRLVPALGDDPGVGCVLLSGAGGAFCAGGDTKVMAEGPPQDREARVRQLKWEHQIPAALHALAKPVVAALSGPAAGAGFALALSCDLRLFAESAFVTTAYVRVGLSGDYGASWFLTRLVGTAKARELFFTGARVHAAEALALGIANRVVPDDELPVAAVELARQIAAGPPVALRYMKENLNRALHEGLGACLDVEAERMVAGAFTEDYVEAMKAFSEKRKPVYRGR